VQPAVASRRETGDRIRVFSENRGGGPADARVDIEIVMPVEDTFQLEVANFLDYVQNGQIPSTADGKMRRSLEIILAAYSSMADGGKMVSLE